MTNFEASQEQPRTEAEVTSLINDSIEEVVNVFSSEMSLRDREMLIGVTTEESTTPYGRITYLRQICTTQGVSKELKYYVNQILQTLQQKFTNTETDKFNLMGKSILEEIE